MHTARTRLGPEEIRVTVVEGHTRLYIAFSGSAFDPVLSDFKDTLVRTHAMGHYARNKCWSLPLSQRGPLNKWLDTVMQPEAVWWAGGRP